MFRLLFTAALIVSTIGCSNDPTAITSSQKATQPAAMEISNEQEDSPIPNSITKTEVLVLVKNAKLDMNGCGETSLLGYPDIRVPWSSVPVYVVLEFSDKIGESREMQLISFSAGGVEFKERNAKDQLFRVNAG